MCIRDRNKAMKIAAFLSGSDPDVDELSALHGNMDIFQAMYMKDCLLYTSVGSRRKSRYGSLSSILCGQSLNMKGRSIL